MFASFTGSLGLELSQQPRQIRMSSLLFFNNVHHDVDDDGGGGGGGGGDDDADEDNDYDAESERSYGFGQSDSCVKQTSETDGRQKQVLAADL